MLAALVLWASLGDADFIVDGPNTTAPYVQQSGSLTLVPPLSFPDLLTGEFSQSLDWSTIDRIFLEIAVAEANPGIFFSFELYGWDGADLQLINSYEGHTEALSSSFSLLELRLNTAGSGDFSNLRVIQFTCNTLPDVPGGLVFRSLVGSAGPIVPVVTSASYADGDFTLTWSGTGTLPVIVERRASLGAGQWTAIAQGVATGQYTDTDPPAGKAFYRVVVP